MGSNFTWAEAVRKVLEEATEPMHYTDIAQEIVDRKLRYRFGATPAHTVASVLSTQMPDAITTSRGVYWLNGKEAQASPALADATEGDSKLATPSLPTAETHFEQKLLEAEGVETQTGSIVNAFGMFWLRSEVDWAPTKPRLYGTQIDGGDKIDFAEQVGVYILYQGERVVYVGQAAQDSLIDRLRKHTRDRLKARWDRFSWFGLRPVDDDGNLRKFLDSTITSQVLVQTLEAVLIEGLEPPQNRRRGDKLEDREFIQETDPLLKKQRREESIMQLLRNS